MVILEGERAEKGREDESFRICVLMRHEGTMVSWI